MRPSVSVVMAVRDGEEYLRDAVDSILEQTLTDLELIVVDDGSADGTSEILASYDDARVRVMPQAARGLAPSLNSGIRAARAPLIARMDADDVSEPARLERQAEFLSSHSDHVLVGSDVRVISEDGEFLYQAELVTDDADIQHCLDQLVTPFYHGAVMFRRGAVIECGLYDERIPQQIEDMLLWVRLRRLGAMANIPEPLYRYRFRAHSLSRQPPTVARAKARILHDAVAGREARPEDVRELTSGSRAPSRKGRASYELDLGKIYLDQVGSARLAQRHFLRAAWLAPASLKAWFNLSLTVLPSFARSVRVRRRNRRIHLRNGTSR